MDRIEVKSFKIIVEQPETLDIIHIGVKRIEVYDELSQLVKIFNRNDTDLSQGFIEKAIKYAKGGHLRVKYVYY
jgi:hypothetical protein